ncbi:hypothetical protein PS880_06211 [Pseudomonas fluorescens]|uniref:Uncharacterized protein n=1 Tax=Pseudomonas fluorescens TaxID=294 RepID=A0A5E7QIT2_PSEFL|nr:hypothetical protein PS880_06211 [Pseudomonas fluorescens]
MIVLFPALDTTPFELSSAPLTCRLKWALLLTLPERLSSCAARTSKPVPEISPLTFVSA